MSHTVTFKLGKPASQFAAGESTGFGIRGGVKYYDRETKSDQWTNYEAAVFVKTEGQKKFYTDNLVEGAIVTASCETLKVRSYETQHGTGYSLDMNNARIEYLFNPNSSVQQSSQPVLVQRAPSQPVALNSYDDDIPF